MLFRSDDRIIQIEDEIFDAAYDIELDIALSMCDSIALLDTLNLNCLTASEMRKSGYIDRLFQNENIRFDSLCGTMILKQ